MQEKRTVQACFQSQNEGKGLWHWLRELLEKDAQGIMSIQRNLERKAQRREGFHRKLGVKGTKRQSSHFPLLPRIGIQVYLEQKQSLIAQIGVLETGKGRERDTETLLPDALCLFTYCSAFSHHPLLWKK